MPRTSSPFQLSAPWPKASARAHAWQHVVRCCERQRARAAFDVGEERAPSWHEPCVGAAFQPMVITSNPGVVEQEQGYGAR